MEVFSLEILGKQIKETRLDSNITMADIPLTGIVDNWSQNPGSEESFGINLTLKIDSRGKKWSSKLDKFVLAQNIAFLISIPPEINLAKLLGFCWATKVIKNTTGTEILRIKTPFGQGNNRIQRLGQKEKIKAVPDWQERLREFVDRSIAEHEN